MKKNINRSSTSGAKKNHDFDLSGNTETGGEGALNSFGCGATVVFEPEVVE